MRGTRHKVPRIPRQRWREHSAQELPRLLQVQIKDIKPKTASSKEPSGTRRKPAEQKGQWDAITLSFQIGGRVGEGTSRGQTAGGDTESTRTDLFPTPKPTVLPDQRGGRGRPLIHRLLNATNISEQLLCARSWSTSFPAFSK